MRYQSTVIILRRDEGDLMESNLKVIWVCGYACLIVVVN
jgi:hypothetical protein